MSKTVKRVMRIIMVSLIATLGAKAEAGYFWFFGKIKFCSVCLGRRTLMEVPPDPNDSTHPHPAVAELRVKTKLVEIWCPEQSAVIQSRKPVTLVAETQSDDAMNPWQWDGKTANVFVKVEDGFLKEMFCPDSDPLEVNVQILKMSATANAYECTGSDPTNPCSSRVLVSSMKLNNCSLQPPDPNGDQFYDCNDPDFHHLL